MFRSFHFCSQPRALSPQREVRVGWLLNLNMYVETARKRSLSLCRSLFSLLNFYYFVIPFSCFVLIFFLLLGSDSFQRQNPRGWSSSGNPDQRANAGPGGDGRVCQLANLPRAFPAKIDCEKSGLCEVCHLARFTSDWGFIGAIPGKQCVDAQAGGWLRQTAETAWR